MTAFTSRLDDVRLWRRRPPLPEVMPSAAEKFLSELSESATERTDVWGSRVIPSSNPQNNILVTG